MGSDSKRNGEHRALARRAQRALDQTLDSVLRAGQQDRMADLLETVEVQVLPSYEALVRADQEPPRQPPRHPGIAVLLEQEPHVLDVLAVARREHPSFRILQGTTSRDSDTYTSSSNFRQY